MEKKCHKKLKNLGKEYTSISGKVVCEKKMRTGCSENCKRKCHESFDCEKRNEIFEQFWSAGEINQQRQFIADHVQRIATKRKTTGKEASSRKFSFLYCLSVENCQASSVCKKFFLDTLGIKEDVVYGACKKKCSGGVVTSDQRGRHMKQRRVADSIKRGIRQHIESFTPVESHYCRKQTDRKYLPESLSLRKMYRLYQDSCKEQGTTPAMEATYRKIFNREFNYYFFTPKKRSVRLLHTVQKH